MNALTVSSALFFSFNFLTISVLLSSYIQYFCPFTFILKQPPASVLIKEELKLKSGSARPNQIKVGKITVEQLKKIAEQKMPDLNANDPHAAAKIIAGTAKSMGLTIEGQLN